MMAQKGFQNILFILELHDANLAGDGLCAVTAPRGQPRHQQLAKIAQAQGGQ
jgi:hypothetical protein